MENNRFIKLKQMMCLFLAVLMSLSFLSCSEATVEETDAAQVSAQEDVEGAEETEPQYLDDLPLTMDFDGYNVRFLSASETVSIALTEDDRNGDEVNEAYWLRNELIKERMNVEIVLANQPGYDEVNNIVPQTVAAQSDDYDVICGHTRYNVSLASKNCVLKYNEYEFMDYINPDKPYWSKLFMENVNYKENIYWLAGDITNTFIKNMYATFVNATVWNNYYPGQNIYDIVFEGNWTLDTLNNLCEGVYRDNNGNSKADPDDTFGFAMANGHVLNGLFFAANTQYTGIDDAGEYYVMLNNEHTVDVFDKLHRLTYQNPNGYMCDLNDDDTAMPMFANDQVLFFPKTFGFASDATCREMESDFYIIPLPKYDENQENYRTNQYDGTPIYGVPTTIDVSNIPMLASVLEAMCSMTSDMVIPVYYDISLKFKYSRDTTTAQMVDLIHDTVTADFCFNWGNSIGGLINIFYDSIADEEIASKLKRNEKVWARSLDNLLSSLES